MIVLRKGKSQGSRRLVVVGLDGVPCSFVKRMVEAGRLPSFAKLLSDGAFRPINSVYPTVSSVAWASYMTGRNPGGHGIFGFVDRKSNSYDIFIPTAKHMIAPTIWQLLSEAGKRVVVINVPATYPPKPVHGVLISGFLCTNIEKVAYPPEITETLKKMGYVIDVDPWLGHKEDKSEFLGQLHAVLEKRLDVAFYLMEKEKWDFFQLHIMGTDRINHFLWEYWENGDRAYAPEFLRYYEKVDNYVGEIAERAERVGAQFVVLSDHGFCSLKKEVYISHFLAEKGWMKYKTEKPKSLADIHPDSKAYSLIPGRIFLNVRSREPAGVVSPGVDYEEYRNMLKEDLLQLTDGDGPIISKVFAREDLYTGPASDRAPDLIAVPVDGYDLKGNMDKSNLSEKGTLLGTHTFGDAFLYIRNHELSDGDVSVVNLAATVFELMGISPAAEFERPSVLQGSLNRRVA